MENIEVTSEINALLSSVSTADSQLAFGSLGIGTAGFEDSAEFATASQGTLAESALQPLSVDYQGLYDNGSSAYGIGAVVIYNYLLYRKVSNPYNPGYPPSGAAWELFEPLVGSPAYDLWIAYSLSRKAPLDVNSKVPYINVPPVRPSDIHGVTQFYLLGNYNDSAQPFAAEPVGLGGGLQWMGGAVERDALTGDVSAASGSNVTTLATNIAGNKAFTSTVRPISNGTGTPTSTSLITLADGDGRYGRLFSGISIDSVSSSNTTLIKVASVLLPIGLYYIDSLVSSVHGIGLCTIGLIANQAIGINVVESYGNDLTAHITNPIGSDNFTSSTRSAVSGTAFSRRVAGIVQITTANTELSIQFSQSVANTTPSVTRKRAYITATKLN